MKAFEKYNLPKTNAAMLRQIADDLETKEGLQYVHVQVYYASTEEIRQAALKKAKKLAKEYGETVTIEMPDGTREEVNP